MNFKQYLSEMPIQLNMVGKNWTNNSPTLGRFDAASSKMLTSDKAKAKIVKRMQNVPYDFNVYFVQTKDKISTAKTNIAMMKYMYPQMGITPEQAPIIDGKINMFITSWEFDPPTSWMIAHRFAHADQEFTGQIQQTIIKAGKQLSRPLKDDYMVILSFGTMKSATTGKLGAADEPSHEIITQFIMTGKVTFDAKRKMWATQKDSDILQQLASELNQMIKEHMQNAAEFVYFLF